MLAKLTTAMAAALDQMSRNFAAAYTGGFSKFIGDILDTLANGEIGITSAAYDVDSLALGGGAFSVNADLTTGLTFATYAGRFYSGGANVLVAAGTLTLTGSATNYVEASSDGVMHVNTASFTAGRLPLYTVITTGSVITSTTSNKALLTLLGNASITGNQLTATAASKAIEKGVGTLTATTSYLIYAPCTGVLTGAAFTSPTGVTSSDTNYWQVSAVELLQTGAGTQGLLAGTAANSTKATGGSSLAANVPLTLTLIPLTVGTERNVIEGDVIAVTFTATGSPSPLTGGVMRLKFSFSN